MIFIFLWILWRALCVWISKNFYTKINTSLNSIFHKVPFHTKKLFCDRAPTQICLHTQSGSQWSKSAFRHLSAVTSQTASCCFHTQGPHLWGRRWGRGELAAGSWALSKREKGGTEQAKTGMESGANRADLWTQEHARDTWARGASGGTDYLGQVCVCVGQGEPWGGSGNPPPYCGDSSSASASSLPRHFIRETSKKPASSYFTYVSHWLFCGITQGGGEGRDAI